MAKAKKKVKKKKSGSKKISKKEPPKSTHISKISIIGFSIFIVIISALLALPSNKVPFPVNMVHFYKYCPTCSGCTVLDAEYVNENINKFFIIDVRKRPQYLNEHIPGSLSIPFDTFMEQDEFLFHPLNRILVVSNSGYRSLAAAAHLKDLGFKNAKSLEGGINGWKYGFE